MAAPTVFKDVFIQIFDVNSVPDFLRSSLPAARKMPFGVVAAKGEYEKKQTSNENTTTANFLVQPFPKNKLKESELWDRYLDVVPDAAVPYWDRQIPFYVRLRKHDLNLGPGLRLEAGRSSINSFVTLNAFGWSTHLEIRLWGSFNPARLAEIMAGLRSRNNPAYVLNGAPAALKDIFKYYRDTLLADGFRPDLNVNTPDNYWHIANVDVIKATGQETKFTRLKTIDLNAFLSVLYPNHAPVQYEMSGEDRIPKVQNLLFTDIEGDYHNFSMNDFNVGAFTFLQAEALAGINEANEMCYARNTSECFWLCYGYFNFRRLTQDAGPTTKIGRLLKSMDQALLNLGRTLNNRTCQGMFRNHKDMPR